MTQTSPTLSPAARPLAVQGCAVIASDCSSLSTGDYAAQDLVVPSLTIADPALAALMPRWGRSAVMPRPANSPKPRRNAPPRAVPTPDRHPVQTNGQSDGDWLMSQLAQVLH